MRAMPNPVGTSLKLIVLLMVETSNHTIAQNTVRDVEHCENTVRLLKERVQINNVLNGSDIEGCYEMKVGEFANLRY